MRNILKNRLALSTVVTTLIILVVSVLLAGVVTYFAINVTSTRVQEEDLALTKQHVWYAADATTGQNASLAAILVINTGGRDVEISKITIRGQSIDAAAHVYYNVTSGSVTKDLAFLTTITSGTTAPSINSNAADASTLTLGVNSLTLQSGKSMIIYITSPDSITINDIGLTVAITVFTSQAMYYKETNVQVASAN